VGLQSTIREIFWYKLAIATLRELWSLPARCLSSKIRQVVLRACTATFRFPNGRTVIQEMISRPKQKPTARNSAAVGLVFL
jgi:hypothetical protein